MLNLIIASVLIGAAFCGNAGDLVSVVVIYRHGDRTPIQPYPTDPYNNASYWPVGYGQLTNLGKMQHYLLGQWLRSRYDGFLSAHYSEKDFYIRSTDTDRTLMSAEANLAGLYPPKTDQVWDPAIPWQPIPIHTTPELEDNVLEMKKDCPKFNLLLEQLLETDYFVNISRQNRDLYAYVTKNTGEQVDDLQTLEYIYSTLSIEQFNNLTLPKWTQTVFPDKMKPWADLSFATLCYTQQMARLRAGPLFYQIAQHFTNATTNVTDTPKFLVFSGHDVTIANVLMTMGAFQYHSPPYASTILFELRRSSSDYYVNVFYRNSSQLQKITLKGCDFDCKLTDFVDILKPVLISRDEWDVECRLGWFTNFLLGVQFVVVLTALATFLVGSVVMLWLVKCCRKIPKGAVATYTQLPVDEIA
jgi:lysosomal acid phosphatase